ncbi:(deoxy)nucleoside triphosphate pyrophosphohydrolase [Campylobacterota bacterium]
MKIVTAAIIKKDNTILVARRAPGEKLEGFWEFPGGKVEDEETLQDCLEREMEEEFGLITKSGEELTSSIYKYEHGSFKIVALESTILSGDLELRVHDKIKWIHIDKLLEVEFLPADIAIAEYLIHLQKKGN